MKRIDSSMGMASMFPLMTLEPFWLQRVSCLDISGFWLMRASTWSGP